MITEKFSCFIYGEGGKDRTFLQKLFLLEKFQYYTQKWTFQFDNASGNSPKNILEKCHKISSPYSYDLVLCFIDLDKLKDDFPKKWKGKKEKLENQYENIHIIWQIENAEDEYKNALGKISEKCKGKYALNNLAKKEVKKFINTEFWKKILVPIQEKERELNIVT